MLASRWAYDALGHEVQLTGAKGNQQRQRFNLAEQLAASELLLTGQTTAQAVVQAIDYSAAGQQTSPRPCKPNRNDVNPELPMNFHVKSPFEKRRSP